MNKIFSFLKICHSILMATAAIIEDTSFDRFILYGLSQKNSQNSIKPPFHLKKMYVILQINVLSIIFEDRSWIRNGYRLIE